MTTQLEIEKAEANLTQLESATGLLLELHEEASGWAVYAWRGRHRLITRGHSSPASAVAVAAARLAA